MNNMQHYMLSNSCMTKPQMSYDPSKGMKQHYPVFGQPQPQPQPQQQPIYFVGQNQYQSAPSYDPSRAFNFKSSTFIPAGNQQQITYYHPQQTPSQPSSMISPPMDNDYMKLGPPWQRKRSNTFILPKPTTSTPIFAMSSYFSEDTRSTETPAPIPIECQLGPGTPSPSPSLPGTPPPMLDVSELMRLNYTDDEPYFMHAKKKRKLSGYDKIVSPVKRHRRTKAEIAADRLQSQMKQIKKISIHCQQIEGVEKTVRLFAPQNSSRIIFKTMDIRIPRMKLVPQNFMRVANIGIMRTQKGFIFSCMSQCRFKTYDMEIFRIHLENHPPTSGTDLNMTCSICHQSNLENNLLSELTHILTNHLLNLTLNEIFYSKITKQASELEESDEFKGNNEKESANTNEQEPNEEDEQMEEDKVYKSNDSPDTPNTSIDSDATELNDDVIDSDDEPLRAKSVETNVIIKTEIKMEISEPVKIDGKTVVKSEKIDNDDPDYAPIGSVCSVDSDTTELYNYEDLVDDDFNQKVDTDFADQGFDIETQKAFESVFDVVDEILPSKSSSLSSSSPSKSIEDPKLDDVSDVDFDPNNEFESEDEPILDDSVTSDEDSLQSNESNNESSSRFRSRLLQRLPTKLRRRRNIEEKKDNLPKKRGRKPRNAETPKVEPLKITIKRKKRSSSNHQEKSSEYQEPKMTRTRRKSCFYETDFVVESVKEKVPIEEIVKPKSKRGRKKKVIVVESSLEQPAECLKPVVIDEAPKLPAISETNVEDDAQNEQNAAENSSSIANLSPPEPSEEEKKSEVDKLNFLNRIPDFLVMKINEHKQKTAMNVETICAASTTEPNTIELLPKTEPENLVEIREEAIATNPNPDLPDQSTPAPAELPSTSKHTQILEDIVLTPKDFESVEKKLLPTARKKCFYFKSKKLKKLPKGRLCSVDMTLSGSLKLLIESAVEEYMDESVPEVSENFDMSQSSDRMEIDYDEKVDETLPPPPVAVKDFPALMESPEKSQLQGKDKSRSDEEDIFFDSVESLDNPVVEQVNHDAESVEVIPRSALTNLTNLFPWIVEDIVEKWSKSESCAKALLSEKSLFSTYKCMAIECSYHSTNLKTFHKHLSKHLGDKHFLCCFCLSDEKDPIDLVSHLEEFHSADRYQCSKCMYRACEKFYVDIHRNRFHPNVIAPIFKSPIQKCFTKERLAAKTKVESMMDELVKPMKCDFCSKSFFLIDEYANHLQKEYESTNDIDKKNLVCIEIKRLQKNLDSETCEYGQFQCAYCLPEEAFSSEEMIREHLSVVHPHELAFIYERKKGEDTVDLSNEDSEPNTQYKHVIDLVDKKKDISIRIKTWSHPNTELTSKDKEKMETTTSIAPVFMISNVTSLSADE